jgi:tRNA U34 5-methylaminomethyl-2-thiouridine-forming methyltransferase MnmC
MKQPKIFITEDGSSSLYLEEINESYHSKYGAVNESRHVFIKSGLHQFKGEKQVHILEVGFGTGLNALLTLVEACAEETTIHYDAIEPYPLSEVINEKLNYSELPGFEQTKDYFMVMHKAPFDKTIKINDNFTLRKLIQKLEKINLNDNFYHLVYFDAFSPEVQPELWTLEIFSKLFCLMRPGAIMVTYCAKGNVRRNMKEAGFEVERLPGPKGKREMIRASKPDK